ncbi:MAG: hypothetical protein A2V88_10800 [Elusimicrobia bacterium RBG_16_66_12]|nr:MAG: hypothetical protein A2V88_10800 [Elusimicrobia bacterium RBG_16_66_12]
MLTAFGIDAEDFALGIPSLSHGDFNGDGLADILIGAPLADGPDNSRDGAGEAYVIFGRSQLPTTLDLAKTQDLIISGGAQGDALGFSVLGADVNGDGRDDILVGAPGASGLDDPRTDQGQVYIFFGSEDLGGVLDIAKRPQALTITGAEGFSRVGHAIASGDVNGDGTSDIVLGAPFAGREPGTPPGGPRTELGETYVVLGGADLSEDIGIHRNEQDFTISGGQQFGQFGGTVATGDLNADDIEDIIVGAPQSDGSGDGPEASGAVYVFFGAEGLGGRVSIVEGAEAVLVVGAGERDSLGFPLATGDFNGDGIEDVAMGAQRAQARDGGKNASGVVYVMLGRSDLAGVRDLAAGGEDAAIIGAQAAQLLPSSLAGGDLNGDGAADLVLGAGTAHGPGGRDSSGLTYVILGGPNLSTVNLAEGRQSLAIVGVDAGDLLGASVAVAAIRGDQMEIILMAAAADGQDNTRTDSGEIYVVDAGPLGQ